MWKPSPEIETRRLPRIKHQVLSLGWLTSNNPNCNIVCHMGIFFVTSYKTPFKSVVLWPAGVIFLPVQLIMQILIPPWESSRSCNDVKMTRLRCDVTPQTLSSYICILMWNPSQVIYVITGFILCLPCLLLQMPWFPYRCSRGNVCVLHTHAVLIRYYLANGIELKCKLSFGGNKWETIWITASHI